MHPTFAGPYTATQWHEHARWTHRREVSILDRPMYLLREGARMARAALMVKFEDSEEAGGS